MKKMIFCALALTISNLALAENKFGIGAGIGVSNSIYKDTEDKAYPIPLLDINYGNFYIKGITPGYFIFKNEMISLSTFINPISGFPIKAKDIGEGYTNIDDRDFQAMIGLRADLNTGIAGFKSGASIQFGKHGSEAKISLFRPSKISDKLTLIPGIHIKGYSRSYTNYYFGVTYDEANRSSKDNLLKEYEAKEATSIGATLSAEYNYNEKLSFIGILGLEKFDNEITKSPITNDNSLFLVSVGMKYYLDI